MKTRYLGGLIIVLSIFTMFMGCASPQEKSYKAQEKTYKAQEALHQRRLELIDQYQKCLKEAGSDETERALCEDYLKAVESLK